MQASAIQFDSMQSNEIQRNPTDSNGCKWNPTKSNAIQWNSRWITNPPVIPRTTSVCLARSRQRYRPIGNWKDFDSKRACRSGRRSVTVCVKNAHWTRLGSVTLPSRLRTDTACTRTLLTWCENLHSTRRSLVDGWWTNPICLRALSVQYEKISRWPHTISWRSTDQSWPFEMFTKSLAKF